jgi:hypothetical protein
MNQVRTNYVRQLSVQYDVNCASNYNSLIGLLIVLNVFVNNYHDSNGAQILENATADSSAMIMRPEIQQCKMSPGNGNRAPTIAKLAIEDSRKRTSTRMF